MPDAAVALRRRHYTRGGRSRPFRAATGVTGYLPPHPKELHLSVVDLLHDRLATSVLIFMAAVGVWGLWSFLRGGSLSGSLAGALIIGQVLVAVQIVAGVALYLGGRHPATPVHYVYGITAVLVLPFVWSYLRDRDQRLALLYYSLLTLFVAGLAIRGMTTGH